MLAKILGWASRSSGSGDGARTGYLAVSSGEEMSFNSWDGADFMTTPVCAKRVYDEAGITRTEIFDRAAQVRRSLR